MTDLGPVERLAAGAVGEPGARTFYLEVGGLASTHWFVLEKEQVAALAREALATLRREGYETESPGVRLSPPAADAVRVAEMRVGYRDGVFHFVVVPDGEDDEPEPLEFEAAAGVVAAMAGPALEAVGAGRPRCPRCGLPEDPAGHVCPASNGDLRRRR